jgi:hypothetical protein
MAQGRNELCECGSGKKYKKCCLLSSPRLAETDEDILDRAVPPSAIQCVMDEVDRWTARDFDRHSAEAIRRHPVLMSFVATMLTSLRDTPRNQSLLVILTLIRIFETHYGRRHDVITESDVTRAMGRNRRLVADTFKGRNQQTGDVVQPFLLKFIGDVLFDFEADETPRDQEGFVMLMTAKTALDVLDRAYSRKGLSPDPVLAVPPYQDSKDSRLRTQNT